MKHLGKVLVINLSNLKPEPYWKEDKQKNDVTFTQQIPLVHVPRGVDLLNWRRKERQSSAKARKN